MKQVTILILAVIIGITVQAQSGTRERTAHAYKVEVSKYSAPTVYVTERRRATDIVIDISSSKITLHNEAHTIVYLKSKIEGNPAFFMYEGIDNNNISCEVLMSSENEWTTEITSYTQVKSISIFYPDNTMYSYTYYIR